MPTQLPAKGITFNCPDYPALVVIAADIKGLKQTKNFCSIYWQGQWIEISETYEAVLKKWKDAL